MKVTVKQREFFYKTKDSANTVTTISVFAENRTAADKLVKETYPDCKTKFVYMAENNNVYEISPDYIMEYGTLIESDNDF